MEVLFIEGFVLIEMEVRFIIEECECISGEIIFVYSYNNKNNLYYKCVRCIKFYVEILFYLVVWRGFFLLDDYKKEFL